VLQNDPHHLKFQRLQTTARCCNHRTLNVCQIRPNTSNLRSSDWLSLYLCVLPGNLYIPDIHTNFTSVWLPCTLGFTIIMKSQNETLSQVSVWTASDKICWKPKAYLRPNKWRLKLGQPFHHTNSLYLRRKHIRLTIIKSKWNTFIHCSNWKHVLHSMLTGMSATLISNLIMKKQR
jgi:hypothetical protein